jgi:hypothetical protein
MCSVILTVNYACRVGHVGEHDLVAVDEFDRASVRVGVSPFPTLAMLTFDALQPDIGLGAPGALKHEIRAQLRRRDVQALVPFGQISEVPPPFTGARLACPNSYMQVLCGSPASGSLGVRDALERLVETNPDRLLRGIDECSGTGTYWPALHERPSRWLRDVAYALLRAWSAVEALWIRSRPILEREVERVGAAIAHGAAADLAGDLHPGVSIKDEWLRLPNDLGDQTEYRLAPRFTLYPMLVDRRTVVSFHDGAGHLDALFYPLAGAWRAFGAVPCPPPASLSALVGPQRARILRLLDAPTTAGSLAATLQLAPGGVTHHLKALEAAGLVRRTPQGRHASIERTARGTSLLALYE